MTFNKKAKKILINTSNIKKSGALQVTLSFLEEIKNNSKYEFVIVLSNFVESKFRKTDFGSNFTFYSVDLILPTRLNYRSFIKAISKIEEDEKPDFVFSIFGPTYWKPKTEHICGFANPWLINSDSKFIQNLPIKKKIKLHFENRIKSIFFRRDSKYFITETKDVKNRVCKYLKIPDENIFVVSSTYNHFFTDAYKDKLETIDLGLRKDNSLRLLTISLNFSHKNLKIIHQVDQLLKEKGHTNIFFYVTLPQSDYNDLFGKNPNIINLGVVLGSNCPSLYNQCDALFLPTLLECFSATYPESMISKTPIITSDLDFAKTVCKNAAIYFDPYDATDIVRQILFFKLNRELRKKLIKNGSTIVSNLPNASERADEYLNIIENLCQK
jgi:glycosyltransferase involved in cell wall biosynthesis